MKNDYEKLIIKDYKDCDDLVREFNKEVDSLQEKSMFDCVSVYGNAEFIYDLFKQLFGTYEVGAINFYRDYFNEEYNSAYCLRVYDDRLITIEKAYNENKKPYGIDGVVFFYQEDCKQDLINVALKGSEKVILFGFDDEEKVKPKESSCLKDGHTICKPDGFADVIFNKDDLPVGVYFRTKEGDTTRTFYYTGNEILTSKKIRNILNEYGF